MTLLIINAISAVNAVVIDKPSFRLTNNDYNCLNQKMSGLNKRNWSERAKLLASDGTPFDHFGISVSTHGDYALIGAYFDDENGECSGSAYVFKRDGNNWSEQDKLIASDGATYDQFGYKVSIYEDYALIGAHWDDDNGEGSGSAYVFKRDGNNWIQQAKLMASDGAANDHFGYSVSIYKDYALIGAHRDDDNGNYSGSAFIFKRDGHNWIEQAKLLASDGAEGDDFGGSVSINGDTAIIGAHFSNNNGINTGSAYAFVLDNEPPSAPTINGPTNGKPGVNYNYTFVSTDPEGDDVWYHISWDEHICWLYGPYPSGEEITLSHNWSEKGTYLITCWARDIYNAESNTTTLEVTIPRNKAATNPIWLRLLERLPLLQKLLKLGFRL